MSLLLAALLLTTLGGSATQASIGACVEAMPIPKHIVQPVVRRVPKPRPRALPSDVPRKPVVVILEGVLGADRRVSQIKVLHGMHPALDVAATEAVARSVFTVGTADGKPVSFYCTFTVTVDPRGWPGTPPRVTMDPAARPISPAQLTGIHEGLTWAEVLERLGPASSDPCSGIYCLQWRCTDGRVLLLSGGNPLHPSERPEHFTVR